jgi:hypothetical protein
MSPDFSLQPAAHNPHNLKRTAAQVAIHVMRAALRSGRQPRAVLIRLHDFSRIDCPPIFDLTRAWPEQNIVDMIQDWTSHDAFQRTLIKPYVYSQPQHISVSLFPGPVARLLCGQGSALNRFTWQAKQLEEVFDFVADIPHIAGMIAARVAGSLSADDD